MSDKAEQTQKLALGDRVRFRDPDHVIPLFSTSSSIDLRGVFVVKHLHWGTDEVELTNKLVYSLRTVLREIEPAMDEAPVTIEEQRTMEFRGIRLKEGDRVRFANPKHFPELIEKHGVDSRRTFTVDSVTPRRHGGPGVLAEYWYHDVTFREVRGFAVSSQQLVLAQDRVAV